MEQYYEQSVAGRKNARSNLVYGLFWLLIVVCLIAAMVFASGIFVDSARTLTYTNHALEVNWLNVLGTALCMLAAGTLFARKDYLRVEYDYFCRDGVLEVWAILNRRRRRQMLKLDVNRITEAGAAGEKAPHARPGTKINQWYVREGRYYLCYMEGSERRMALLELNDEFAAQIRRQLPMGVWR